MESMPTNSELEILNVLWKRGPSSVREVHEEIQKRKPTGYTTILKLMQIMADKGLVLRDESQRAHIYSAKPVKSDTQKSLLEDLVDRAFGGSVSRLALHALNSRKSTPEELAEIRTLIDELEKES